MKMLVSVIMFLYVMSSYSMYGVGVSNSTAGQAISQSISMATGGSGSGVSVNEQTGQVEYSIGGLSSSGITGDMDINIGLIPSPQPSKRLFGLSSGYSFNIDYIDTSAGVLYTASGRNYYLVPNDATFPSGLRYIKTDAIAMSFDPGTVYGIDYHYKLHMHTGENEYFNDNGLLVVQENRFQSHIIYNYDGRTPYDAKLRNIIDSYGNTINFNYAPSGKSPYTFLTISKSNGDTVSYGAYQGSTTEQHLTITDVHNQTTDIVTDPTTATNRATSITYANGLKISFEYSPNISYQTDNGNDTFYAVSSETIDPGSGTAGVQRIDYTYEVIDGHNYTGNGVCFFDGINKDALMEQMAYNYFYTTRTTKYIDIGEIITETTYNFLHLPVKIMEYSKDNNGVVTLLTEKQMIYDIGTVSNPVPMSLLSTNYSSPTAVYSAVFDKDPNGNRVYYASSTEYEYDEYGAVTKENSYEDIDYDAKSDTFSYDHNSPDITRESEYFNDNYGLEKSEQVRDNLTGNYVRTDNTLDIAGIYISQITPSLYIKGKTSRSYVEKITEDDSGRVIKDNKAIYDGTFNPKVYIEEKVEYTLDDTKTFLTTTTTNTSDFPKVSSKVITSKETDNIIRDVPVNKVSVGGDTTYYTFSSDYNTEKISYNDNSTITTNTKVDENSGTTVDTIFSNGYMTESVYDGIGNLITSKDNIQYSNKDFNYGLYANRLTGTNSYNLAGQLSTSKDVAGHVTTYQYDFFGRNTQVIDYLKNTKEETYCLGGKEGLDNAGKHYASYSSTAVNGITTDKSYIDKYGHEIEQDNIVSNSSSTAEYDTFGNIKSSNVFADTSNPALGKATS
ncbi:MAG: RHS repeat domain-containing protein, partial [Deltaproteobacteria bacterium]